MIRVLFDARKARDFGIGAYVLGLIGGLVRRGDIHVAAVVRPEDSEHLPAAADRVVSGAPHYSLAELVAVRNAIRRVKPDIFHAPHYVVPFFPPRATVVTIHDLMHLNRPEHASPVKRAYAHWMFGRVARRAARVIAVSEATKRDLAAFDPLFSSKTVVIPNGVGERFFEGESNRDASVLQKWGLAAGYLLFLGNDKPHKNLGGLLDAMALLDQSSFSKKPPAVSPVSLVLAGGAAERAAERAKSIAARGLAGRVIDLGVVPTSDVPMLLRAASVLVLPSFAEGFGIPVLEAQATGTPVVCSDRGGLREAAGDAAIYVDPERPESIAAGLEQVLNDEKTRERISSEGRKRARFFTWDAVAARTAAVYEEALRGSPSSLPSRFPVVFS